MNILTQEEFELLGPPAPEALNETDVSETFISELALKHVAMLPEPTTESISERLCLPRALTEEVLHGLYREKLIEVRASAAPGASRYAMLDHGWERVSRVQSVCGYTGPCPVSLADYAYMIRAQAVPQRSSTMDSVREVFRDLVLPESLLQTLGCVINSRRSLFLTGLPGTGKTAVAERINAGLGGSIWIPYAVEIDGQVIRIFDAHNHRAVKESSGLTSHDRRWLRIKRPLVIVGGELTLENADLQWSAAARFYEAPFQMKANGGTLVIDDFGRQRVEPHDLLNRWIIPLEKRVDYLTLQTGKKLEVPFEQLVVFSTNLDEKDLVDEAFLRRMGYRARVEPPTPEAFAEIFRRQVEDRKLETDAECIGFLLEKYGRERRVMKGCEPRDLLDRATDICRFNGGATRITPDILEAAWRNYFGASHGFSEAAATGDGQGKENGFASAAA